VVDGVQSESFGLRCPELTNPPKRGEPAQTLEALREVVRVEEDGQVGAKTLVGLVAEPPNGCVLDRAVPRIARLQDLVEVDPNPLPLTNPRFVHLDGGRVSIVTKSAETFTKHVQLPSGSARVVQWPAVREKFRRLVGNAGMPEDQVAEILRRIESFEGLGSPSELTALLQLPAGT